MITVEVDGVEYTGFIGVSVTDSIDNLCNQYRQECTTDTGGTSFPIKRGSTVKVYVEGVQVFNGHCEISRFRGSKNDYSVTSEGRDVSKVILKTWIPPDFSVKGPIALSSLLKKSLSACSLSFNVSDETGGIDDLTKKEIVNDDVGTNLWDYWIELARKRQTLITDNREDNIVLFRPGSLKYKCRIVNRLDDSERMNNIISSSLECNDSDRYSKYVVHGQYNFSVKKGKKLPAEGQTVDNIFNTDATDTKPDSAELTAYKNQLASAEVGSEEYFAILGKINESSGGSRPTGRRSRVSTIGVAVDKEITDGSVKHIVAKKPSDDDECERLAKWHANLARAKSISYTCTMPYLTADGEPWKSGYLIDVEDEDADVDATMLIKQVEFSVSKGKDGSAEYLANLSMTVPDAYTENAEVDDTLVYINRIGGNWNNGVFL
jgi:prophage tail gpP-like protein